MSSLFSGSRSVHVSLDVVMLVRSGCIFAVVALLAIGCGGDENSSSPGEEMAEGHEGDTPTATEAAREPAAPVDAETVVYGTVNGDEMTGYFAVPSNPDSVLRAHGLDPSSAHLPALVVVHEWWGLNENIRTVTRRLAGAGYQALAVDLYDDSTATTPEEARALTNRATDHPDRLMANLRTADEYLRLESNAPRVGVIGWCFGGGMTFRAVADRPSAFDAAVAYYGSPEAVTGDVLEQMTTPILAHFGRQDEVVSTEQVEAFRTRVEEREASVEIYEYDAGHAFANPSGESYDREAARTAWSRTTDFLEMHLHANSPEN